MSDPQEVTILLPDGTVMSIDADNIQIENLKPGEKADVIPAILPDTYDAEGKTRFVIIGKIITTRPRR